MQTRLNWRIRIAGVSVVALLAALVPPVPGLGAPGPAAANPPAASAPASPPAPPAPAPDPRPSPEALAKVPPAGPGEVVALRGPSRRVFQTPEGPQVQLFLRPIHARNAEGVFEPIDHTVVPEQAHGFAFRNRLGDFNVRFADTPGAQRVQLGHQGQSVAFGLDESAGPVRGKARQGQMEYWTADGAMGYRYQVAAGRLKEEIVLQRPTTRNRWRFPLTLDGLVPLATDGQIHLAAATAVNEPVWSLAPAFAVDAAGSRTEQVTQRLEPDGEGRYAITLEVDPAWLGDAARQWPVLVDPTFVAAGSGYWAQIRSDVTTPITGATYLSTSTQAPLQYGLIKFDLTQLRDLLVTPAQVTSAQLRLYRPYSSWASGTSVVAADMVTRAWLPGLVTWNQPRWNVPGDAAAANWAYPGGDVCFLTPCPDMTTEILNLDAWYELGDTAQPVRLNVRPLVQAWLNGTPNYGLRLRGKTSFSGTPQPGNILPDVTSAWEVQSTSGRDSGVLELFLAPDTTRPTVTLTPPPTGEVGGLTPEAAVGDQIDGGYDGTLARKQFLVDNVLFATVSAAQVNPWLDLSKLPRGQHRLTVRAYDAAGNFADATAEVTAGGLLTPPGNLRAIATGPGQTLLKWAPARTANAPGLTPLSIEYRVYGAADPSFAGESLIATTFNRELGLSSASLRYFRVVAVTGDVRSVPSNTATIAAPLAPVSLAATALAGGQVRLDWAPSPSSADDPGLTYDVFGDGEAAPVATGVTGSTWTETLPAGTTRTYRVGARDRAGTVSATGDNLATAIATAVAGPGPGVPTAVKITAERGGRVGLSWQPVSAGAQYHVWRAESDDQGNPVAWQQVTATPLGGWFYLDDGLVEGATYQYRVQAVENGAAGPLSPPVLTTVAPVRRLGVDDRMAMAPWSGGFLNLQSGNLVLQATDGVLTGPVLAGAVRRTYNSQGCTCGLLGPGWRFNFEFRLENLGDHLILTEGDGTEHRFRPGAAAGIWVSDEPRYYWSVTQAADGSYAVTEPGETEMRFDAAGRLQQIVDRTGNALTYTYDPNRPARVTRVTNSAGRSVDFTYYYMDSDLVSLVEFPSNDPNTPLAKRQFRYDYDSSGRLTGVTTPEGEATAYAYDGAGQITRVTDPAGRWIDINHAGARTTLTDALGNRTQLICGTGLCRLIDPTGQTTRFQTNAYGWLTGRTDPLLNTWSVADDLSATATTITETDPRGRVVQSSYDDRGNLVRVDESGTDLVAPGVDSRSIQYVYGGSNNAGPNDRVRAVDAEGNTTEYFYTAAGPKRVERIVDAGGGETRFTYNTLNPALPETITDPNGNTRTFQYTPTWDLASTAQPVTDPATGAVRTVQQTFTYAPDGSLVQKSEPNYGDAAAYSQIAYDRDGRAVRADFPDGSQQRTVIDASGRVGATVGPDGGRQVYTYDGAGRLAAVTADTVVPDAAVQPLVTAYTYTGAELTGVTAPDGSSARFQYDALGRVAAEQHPDGTVTRTEFDAVGNATAVLNGPGDLWADAASPRAYRVTASYYLANLLRSATAPLPDSALLPAAGAPSTAGCAGAGTQCNTSTYTYDRAGRKRTETDGNGLLTRYAYDSLNRLTAVTDPLGRMAEYEYDRSGNRTRVWKVGYGKDKPGQIPDEYAYDELNRLVRSANPVAGVQRSWTYSYNAASDRVQETAPGQVTRQFEYDAGHRLSRVSYSLPAESGLAPTPELRFAADAGGRPLLRRDGFGTTWYAYDGLGRPTRVRGLTETTDYAYSAAGRLAARTSGLGTVQYGYDAAGRLASVTDPLGNQAAFAFDDYGRPSTVTLPNAALTNTYYRMPDRADGSPGPDTGLLKERRWRSRDGSQIWWAGGYRYDHPGNVRDAGVDWHPAIATEANKLPVRQILTYTYDQAYRLTSYTDTDPNKAPNNTFTYQYDPGNNRTLAGNVTDNGQLKYQAPGSAAVSLERQYHATDAHETSVWGSAGTPAQQTRPYAGGPTYTWTDAGHVKSERYSLPSQTTLDPHKVYDYDGADRIARLTQTSQLLGLCYGLTRDWSYDGLGRLAKARTTPAHPSCSSTETVYSYDGQTVIAEQGTNGQGHTYYITTPGGTPLFSLRPVGRELKPYSHVTDHLGSTVAIVAGDNTIPNWYAYDPFGIIQGSGTQVNNNYTFTSSVRDAATDLYFMGARIYSPEAGRFLTADSYRGDALRPGTQNLFTYTANNPINYVDPSGHNPVSINRDPGTGVSGVDCVYWDGCSANSATFAEVEKPAATGVPQHGGGSKVSALAALVVATAGAVADALPGAGPQDQALKAVAAAALATIVAASIVTTKTTTADSGPKIMYHYTDAEGYAGIKDCRCIEAHTDMYGVTGVFLTPMPPTTLVRRDLSRLLWGIYWHERLPKTEFYVAVDVKGLPVQKDKFPFHHVIRMNGFLPIGDRLIAAGNNPNPE